MLTGDREIELLNLLQAIGEQLERIAAAIEKAFVDEEQDPPSPAMEE